MSFLAHRARTQALRQANADRFKGRNQAPGDCHFNTHHQVYQALGPHGTLWLVEAHLVEMTEAQWQRWLARTERVRELARRGVETCLQASVTTDERTTV